MAIKEETSREVVEVQKMIDKLANNGQMHSKNSKVLHKNKLTILFMQWLLPD